MPQKTIQDRQEKMIRMFSNRGFTLSELLMGAAMTTAVIAVAGYGISNLLSSSTASNARSQGRAELNRSIDFIASEVRESSSLVKDVLTVTPPSAFTSSYSGKVSGAVTPVLMVNNPATGSTPIIYYIATPTSGLWKGPRVVYRWGPTFNTDSTYANAATPATWTSEALVDGIQTASGSTTTIGSGSTTGSCPSGYTKNGDNGFYSCIDAAGKTAQLYQNGKIAKLLGSSETYNASMNTGSRRTTLNRTPPPIAQGASSAALSNGWTLNGGTVTTTKPLTMNVRYLGGDIVCGSPMYPIPTQGTVTLRTGNGSPVTTNLTTVAGTDTTFSNVAANTTMTISGIAVGNGGSGSCNGSNFGPYDSTNITQVRSLKNGDAVPQTPGYLGQASIDAYLTSASTNPVTGRPIINTATQKVDLADNQVIYLYELGVTDPASPAFDIQDMVILATFQ